jgi:L-aminopeptidase/D-esterase-like protein
VTPGKRNLLTDIAGIRVGHADDARLASGVTAVVFDPPAVVSVDVRGGGPGNRETDLLDPSRPADRIDAIALSGGSAFGLDAAGGLQAFCAASVVMRWVARVPLVPGRSCSLLNGGDGVGPLPALSRLGFAAAQAAGWIHARQRRRQLAPPRSI